MLHCHQAESLRVFVVTALEIQVDFDSEEIARRND